MEENSHWDSLNRMTGGSTADGPSVFLKKEIIKRIDHNDPRALI